jgi:hypothetical protein
MKSMIASIAVAGALLGAGPAFAGLVLGHAPPASAPPDQPLRLDFVVTPVSAWQSGEVRWRPLGARAWRSAPILLDSPGGFRATLPAPALDDPGLEYFVLATDTTGTVWEEFASQAAPHPVLVRAASERLQERVTLLELQGQRSELHVQGTWVDYRTFGPAADTPADLGPGAGDLSLAYRHWLLRGVEYIEVGVGRLQGVAAPSTPPAASGPPERALRVGFKRGWTEIGVRPGEYVGLAGRLVLGADEERFRVGLTGRLRLGKPRRTHLIADFGHTAGVGTQACVGLHLATIPRVPVSFEVEITNTPNDGKDFGERGHLRVGYELSRHVVAHLGASYQALTGNDHGLGGGAELELRF